MKLKLVGIEISKREVIHDYKENIHHKKVDEIFEVIDYDDRKSIGLLTIYNFKENQYTIVRRYKQNFKTKTNHTWHISNNWDIIRNIISDDEINELDKLYQIHKRKQKIETLLK